MAGLLLAGRGVRRGRGDRADDGGRAGDRSGEGECGQAEPARRLVVVLPVVVLPVVDVRGRGEVCVMLDTLILGRCRRVWRR
ncbi:hypothetical protein MM440_01530 [Arsenicicoccus piscis]|uniref:hypothetical protein n=1 Tax=Arsenicicoccus piscis TaxID=673954 RepID=UPI001F4D2089|nr:hypothetical protein [Arsenicicoccus piscis]MCH8626498.1 hypothetical protein [Arsenicicoccus piscis]